MEGKFVSTPVRAARGRVASFLVAVAFTIERHPLAKAARAKSWGATSQAGTAQIGVGGQGVQIGGSLGASVGTGIDPDRDTDGERAVKPLDHFWFSCRARFDGRVWANTAVPLTEARCSATMTS